MTFILMPAVVSEFFALSLTSFSRCAARRDSYLFIVTLLLVNTDNGTMVA
jgi:hypothetical protein